MELKRKHARVWLIFFILLNDDIVFEGLEWMKMSWCEITRVATIRKTYESNDRNNFPSSKIFLTTVWTTLDDSISTHEYSPYMLVKDIV